MPAMTRPRFAASLLAASIFALATTAQAQTKDTYNVALDGTFAPHAMPKLGGGIEGFNVDLTEAIAKQLGVTMNITPAQFSGLIPAMQAGTYDFLVAPTTITEERAESMLFSEGYLDTGYQFIVKKGAEGEGADDPAVFTGKTISVNKGSAYDSWARDNAEKYGWTVESYGTNTDAVQAVISGRADASIGGNTVSAWAVKKNPQLALSYLVDTGQVWGMPFRKDDVATRDLVEGAIECLKADGTIAELSKKWFDVDPGPESAARMVLPGYGQPDFAGYDATPHEASCG
ncbi:transporter substrate-binding domain-containing protein [Rhizobiaceae bacterium]|nr:transporter substrate-binding domain-containing protein [Rhizobiaceae bacterium]